MAVREKGPQILSPVTNYAPAPATSRSMGVLYVLLGLLAGVAVIPLAIGVTPASALAAFSHRLPLYRIEFASLGAVMLVGVAIGFVTLFLAR
jgi:hypothetical protein